MTQYSTEHAEQVAFVQWFRKTYPDVLIFAIPNGGKRGKPEAARLQLEGVTPGVPDLCIPGWRVYIEMKRVKGGSVSKEQKEVIEYLNANGYTAKVCDGFESAKIFIESLK
jgi:hypothetical protein